MLLAKQIIVISIYLAFQYLNPLVSFLLPRQNICNQFHEKQKQ